MMQNEDTLTERALRRALFVAADQLDLSTPGLWEPTPRAVPRRRSRVAVCVGVAVLIAASLAAVVVRNASDADHAASPTASEEVPSLLPSETDFEVLMNVDASPVEISGVRSLLVNSTSVARFAYFDNFAAYERFRKVFCNSPDLVESIGPEALPVFFLIELRTDVAATELHDALQDQPGVQLVASPARGEDSVAPACP